MPVCSGGSTTKAGVPASLVITPQSLSGITGIPEWLWQFFPYHSAVEIGDVSAFCSADRPSIGTTPSALQLLSYFKRDPINDYILVDGFITDVIRAYLWNGLCTCVSGTVTGPTAPTEPTGLPTLNPPSVIRPPAVGACAEYGGTAVFTTNNGAVFVVGSAISTAGSVPLPSGALSYRLTLTVPDDGTPTAGDHQVQCRFWMLNNADTYIAGPTIDYSEGLAPGVYTRTGSVPSTATCFFVQLTPNVTNFTNWNSADVQLEFFCDSDSGNTVLTPCCPPDANLTGLLLQILSQVTLNQRQSTPFAYISGPSHSGLTGTGTVDVSGIIGVLLNTSIPARSGLRVGTPDTHFDVGWINFGTADGYTERQWIESDSQVFFPAAAGVFTHVGYSLLPGVSTTLTELRREF